MKSESVCSKVMISGSMSPATVTVRLKALSDKRDIRSVAAMKSLILVGFLPCVRHRLKGVADILVIVRAPPLYRASANESVPPACK